jgi:hypothetical protein
MAGDGVYRLQSSSPARNLLEGTPLAQLTKVDIDGEERKPNTDAGCNQFSTTSTKPNKRITAQDVGVGAPTSWGDGPKWEPQRIEIEGAGEADEEDEE